MGTTESVELVTSRVAVEGAGAMKEVVTKKVDVMEEVVGICKQISVDTK